MIEFMHAVNFPLWLLVVVAWVDAIQSIAFEVWRTRKGNSSLTGE